MRSFLATFAAVILVAASGTAMATPIVNVDGLFNGSDKYEATLTDAIGEGAFDSSHLDISSVSFACEGTNFYMGLQVATPDISRVGGSTSLSHRTVFDAFITDGTVFHEIDVVLTATKASVIMDGDPTLLLPTDYTVSVANGLEVRINAPDLAALTHFSFSAQLDDTGAAADDQIIGNVTVPEPATMLLAAIGLPMLLRKRRRL